MDVIVVKEEFSNKNQCHTCLSIDRKLKPIGEYVDIYKKIVANDISTGLHNTGGNIDEAVFKVLLCWECESLLRKAQQFQKQVEKAKELLQYGQNYLHGALSNLTSILLNETQPNVIYMNGTNIYTEENHKITPEISDNDFDNEEIKINAIKKENDIICDEKIKKSNRWALKRAEKNKKPKFKIVDNLECFRKLKMDVEEMKRLKERDKKSDTKYKCKKCQFGFNDECLMVKHNKECLKKLSKYCDICKKRFVNKRHLSAHIQRHYDKFSCMLCSYVCYNKDEMRIHTQKDHKRVFECVKCALKFGHRREFYKHYKEWHEKYICDICGISFKMRYCIKDHIRKQHSPYECKPCNKRFARYGGLWLHNKTQHSTPTASAYCVECDTKYVDVYRYKWHLNNSARHKRSQVRRRIPCPGCDKVFTKNIYMKDHYDLVHLKNYKYRCEQCDKNFIRNADLVKHRRRVHEGIQPPRNKICYMCGRGFTTRKILTNHLRTHTGERPFCCACGARFSQSAALAAHTRATGHTHKAT